MKLRFKDKKGRIRYIADDKNAPQEAEETVKIKKEDIDKERIKHPEDK